MDAAACGFTLARDHATAKPQSAKTLNPVKVPKYRAGINDSK
jgi:hypothetical protein